MAASAKIIADSYSAFGKRLTTFELRYQRFIHAEFMTHRVFARNASSSRAIPVTKMIEEIERDMAMPIHWGMNQPGMQARRELPAEDAEVARMMWGRSGMSAIKWAREMVSIGAHKQVINRILEPYSYIRVIASATETSNFFKLRRHPDAQPEMKALADAMWDAREASKPKLLGRDMWHLPYVTDADKFVVENGCHAHPDDPACLGTPDDVDSILRRVSAARCARVSYRLHDGNPTRVEKDLELAGGLEIDRHWSPFEHLATPDRPCSTGIGDYTKGWWHQHEHGNFVGFRQYRRMMPGGIS